MSLSGSCRGFDPLCISEIYYILRKIMLGLRFKVDNHCDSKGNAFSIRTNLFRQNQETMPYVV